MRRCFPTLLSAAAAAAIGLAAPALAQSNTCADAPLIDVGSQWGTTAGATASGTASCGNSNATPDVWYAFTPPASGTLTLSTCDGTTFDTVLSLHAGCPGTTSNQVACNDDACGTRSTLVASVIGGITYRIRVSGFEGAAGSFRLNVAFDPTPASNTCAAAPGIGDGTYTGTTVGAGIDPTAVCVSGNSPDVWYSYTAPFTGTLHVDTCGSGFDTALSVLSGCGAGATILACNDDYGPCGAASGLQIPVTSGVQYRIRVRGFANHAGAYILNVRTVPNPANPCGGGAVIREGTYTGSNVGATADGVDNCSGGAADVWYHYIAPSNGYLSLDTCGSEFDTVLSVHSACGNNIANMIACNDDAPDGPCAGTWFSSLRVPVTGGVRYRIRVTGFADATGNFTLNVGFLPAGADTCATAPFITDGAYTGTSSLANNGATNECGSGGTPDVWYAYRAPATGRLNISLCGSEFDTVLVVYSDCSGSTASHIACNDDSEQCGFQSYLSVSVTAGQTYRIRVAAFSGSGTYALTLGMAACPADWNGDSQVNSGDITAFLTSWLSSIQQGSLVADFNSDGQVNSGDITAFLSAWLRAVQQGC